MKRNIFIIVLLFATTALWAEDFDVDGIYYNILTDNEVEVTYRGLYYYSYDEYAGSVTIPVTVTYNGTTYSVTSIGDYAFRYCIDLTSISIPNSITTIGEEAFRGCSGLLTPVYNAHCFAYMPTSYKEAYAIPEGIRQIASYAFAYCAGLTSIIIPNSVTTIEGEAFRGCSSLTSITIPNSVMNIGWQAFTACTSLTSVTIGNSVTSMGNEAFSDCTNLTSVTISNGVTTIGNFAFGYCSRLTSIAIPNSVTSIGYAAFGFCYSLTSVTIGNGVKSIGDYAFHDCGSLKSVIIPESVTSIGEYAFVDCIGLSSITIPNSVTTIEEGVFYNCKGLTSVTIPSSVTNIGFYAFEYCAGLTSVICKALIPPTLEEKVFKGVSSTIPVYVPCESLSDYQADAGWNYFTNIQCIPEDSAWKDIWCNTWNVFMHTGWADLDTERTWQYKLDRDTIINEKLYTTVIYYLTSNPSQEYYMGAVRFGDDRKVYRAIGNSESVVYDFTVQVGDTLDLGLVYDVKIDSLTNLKTIRLHPYSSDEDRYLEYETITWIEGVGSTDGFLLARDFDRVGGAAFWLLCAYRNDELKYTNGSGVGCRYNAGEVTHDHFPTLAGLSRTIHEERSTNDTTRRDDFTKVVLDRSFPTLYHSQMYLRERDNKIFVESRTYKNLTELYEYVLYDFTLEVGDSLPMLYIDYSSRGNWSPTYPLSILNVVNYRKDADGTIYPGDTLVVTEVSTITLLDGKEYKKWTFNNGMEYAEGIGSLSGDFYELIANKRTTEDLTASQLVCASQNGQLLYKMDDVEMKKLGTECLCEGYVGTSVETIITSNTNASKLIQDGQLFILRDGKTYNAMGVEVGK
jgi:hypothetical protein